MLVDEQLKSVRNSLDLRHFAKGLIIWVGSLWKWG